MNKKILLFVIFLFFLTLVLVGVALLFKPNKITPSLVPAPTLIPIENSAIQQIIPGVSSPTQVEKVMGSPSSKTSDSQKTYFHYSTQSADYTNLVSFKNSVVQYTLSYKFDSSRGDFDEYVNKYGNPSLTLYGSSVEDYPWYLFLKSGIGIQSSNGHVTTVLHFSPQEETSFLNNIAVELKLSKTPKLRQEQLIP